MEVFAWSLDDQRDPLRIDVSANSDWDQAYPTPMDLDIIVRDGSEIIHEEKAHVSMDDLDASGCEARLEVNHRFPVGESYTVDIVATFGDGTTINGSDAFYT